MCWLDKYYEPRAGVPCSDFTARVIKDADPVLNAQREQQEAKERVQLKRRIRQLEALNERLLNEKEVNDGSM